MIKRTSKALLVVRHPISSLRQIQAKEKLAKRAAKEAGQKWPFRSVTRFRAPRGCGTMHTVLDEAKYFDYYIFPA